MVPLNNQNEFLEIGCGVAAQTPTLLSMLPKEMKVIGIDLDPLKIARATEKMRRFRNIQTAALSMLWMPQTSRDSQMISLMEPIFVGYWNT